MDDKLLIEMFNCRSEEAIKCLSEKYGATMYSVSYNILNKHEDAEECVNDAYVGIWNAIPPTNPDSLCAFACRVTRNISLTRYKRNNAAKRKGMAHTDFEEISEFIPDERTVSEELEAKEITETLNFWLSKLNRENLYIFMRRYWYMDSVTDIAKNTELSDAAVYLRIDRMKKSLLKFLTERGILI
ncbi:MAG: sigma-70 family RNA polymerase sigma factor [Clostridia bacterium]|nr:sigma-70 family RNA polymerase sigma factor [Clostridia bacterium]